MAEKIIAVDVVRAHIEDGQHSPRRVTLEVRREDGRIAYVSMPCDGEEMFKFHGYSGPCPVPIAIESMQPDTLKSLHARWKRAELAWRNCQDSDGQVYEPEGLWEERVEAFEKLLAWSDVPELTALGERERQIAGIAERQRARREGEA